MFEKESQLNKPVESELPTGEAKKLQELTQEKWQEHLLLFSKVKNKVLEVNPGFEGTLPLKLEEGKPSPLGLFAEAAFKEKPGELPKGKHALEFWPEHQRSALLGRVIFADKEGRMYRDIDIKGSGYVAEEKYEGRAQIYQPGELRGEDTRSGLLDADMAFLDRQMSEEFLRAGIRTNRVLSIIGLKELITEGKTISLKKAREMGIIDKEFQPVIEVRAFGTKARLCDISGSEFGKANLEDAKKLVSQELGRKETLTNEEYLEWFAKTLGRNLGLMHKNGWFHDYLIDHNITLDCRIVDTDSVTGLGNERDRVSEVIDGRNCLQQLLTRARATKTDLFLDLFYQSYDAVFSPKKREKYFERMKKND